MFFDHALTIALVIFAIGLIHKIDTWFVAHVGSGDRSVPISKRFASGLGGLFGTIFSTRLFSLIKVLVVDVLLQIRILTDRRDPLAWVMHICLFAGFVFLIIFHALGSTFAVAVDPDFQSTLNPWMMLRNIFGLLALVGLILAVVRRVTMKETIKTNGKDIYAIVLVGLIILSGFALEALKIPSHNEFTYMVDDYGDAGDVETTKALEAYWVEHFGVVAPNAEGPFSAELLAQGRDAHETSCMECHSRPQAAFVSYPLSRIVAGMDSDGLRSFVWYVHFLACFVGLALLPFTKMFHIISTPVSLVIAEISGKRQAPAAVSVRQMVELDGCSHGGICHETCPVRKRRLERIHSRQPFEKMFDFMETRSGTELGSREAASS